MNNQFLFQLLYAIVTSNGREAELFGGSFSAACEAFRKSVAGDYFPELWFEVPLMGDPWFDLHALVSHGDVDPAAIPALGVGDGAAAGLRWFAEQREDVRQLALSWDTGSGNAETPAVQLLIAGDDPSVSVDFLSVVGRPDAADAYMALHERLPEGWFACYAGTFPQREWPLLRVECIPSAELQLAYAEDEELLGRRLRQIGFDAFDDTLLTRCRELADTPFQIEYQLDVLPDGTASPTLGVSLRFHVTPDGPRRHPFDEDGDAGKLMRRLEEWGLVDERWHALAQTAFAKRVKRGSVSQTLWCYPTFIKLRWRDGKPLDAKAYIAGGVQ